jgi:hypothetical protein
MLHKAVLVLDQLDFMFQVSFAFASPPTFSRLALRLVSWIDHQAQKKVMFRVVASCRIHWGITDTTC